MRTLRLASALLPLVLLRSALAADEGFVVLKIDRGDDAVFKAVAAGAAAEEKKAVEAEAKREVEAYREAKAAFEKDKANRGREFLEPKPDEAKVSRVKGFPTEAEAKAFAEAEQRKAEGKYAVVQVKDPTGAVTVRAVRQNKVKSLEAELANRYAKRLDEWNREKDAYYQNTVALGGPKPPFSKPAPTKPEVKKLKDGLPDQAAADAAVAELESGGKKKR